MEKPRIFPNPGQLSSPAKIPLVELADCNRVLIENHMGVLAYSTEEIQVRVRYGRLSVCGSHLRLLQLCKEQLVIMGTIDAIKPERR